MKTRYFAKIATLALIMLLGALPMQAQTNNSVTINNLTYEGQSQNGQYMLLS